MNEKIENQLKISIRYLKIFLFYLFITSILRLGFELYFINTQGYPFHRNIFNSNLYLGIFLPIEIFFTGLLSPFLEEFVNRYWLIKSNNKYINKFKLILFLIFSSQILFVIYAFLFPSQINSLNSYLRGFVYIDMFRTAIPNYIYLYIIPLIISIITYLIFYFTKLSSKIQQFFEYLITRYYLFFFYFSSIVFAFNHLELNMNNISKVNFQTIFDFIIRFLIAVLLANSLKFYGIKYTIILHCLYNLSLLFTMTIFWRNNLAWNYRIGLGIIVIFLFILIIDTIKNKKLSSIPQLIN